MIETLVVLAISACAPDGPNVVCHFPAPPDQASHHMRLDLSCRHLVNVNGTIVPGEQTIRPISELLNGRGDNTLRMPAVCSPAKLLITPRVYISAITPQGTGLSVTIENTLDNTVSVGLTCRGPATSGTASATIPARGQADLTLPVAAKAKVSCVLEKVPEAVEGSYQFQANAIYQ